MARVRLQVHKDKVMGNGEERVRVQVRTIMKVWVRVREWG